MNKQLKDITQDELIEFVCEFNLCLPPVAFFKPKIIEFGKVNDNTIFFTYSQKSLKTNREYLTDGNMSFGEEPCICLENNLDVDNRNTFVIFGLRHLGYWHNKGYSILDFILNPDSEPFGGTTPVESVPIA